MEIQPRLRNVSKMKANAIQYAAAIPTNYAAVVGDLQFLPQEYRVGYYFIGNFLRNNFGLLTFSPLNAFFPHKSWKSNRGRVKMWRFSNRSRGEVFNVSFLRLFQIYLDSYLLYNNHAIYLLRSFATAHSNY